MPGLLGAGTHWVLRVLPRDIVKANESVFLLFHPFASLPPTRFHLRSSCLHSFSASWSPLFQYAVFARLRAGLPLLLHVPSAYILPRMSLAYGVSCPLFHVHLHYTYPSSALPSTAITCFLFHPLSCAFAIRSSTCVHVPPVTYHYTSLSVPYDVSLCYPFSCVSY